jgi:hypothetical protein
MVTLACGWNFFYFLMTHVISVAVAPFDPAPQPGIDLQADT